MITTNLTDAKNRLSALIERVEKGETVLILRRGLPVARLVPAHTGPLADTSESGREDLAPLVDQGIVRTAFEPADASVVSEPAPSVKDEAGLLGALLEERRDSR